MSTCYGRLTGNRGSVTRAGSKTSGMTATVQTWDGAVTIRLQADGSYSITEHGASNHAPHKFGGKVIAEGALTNSPAAREARKPKQTEPVTNEGADTTTRLRQPENATSRKGHQ